MAQSLLGLVTLMFLAWLLSEDRRRVDWRLLVTGLALQFAIALLLLKVPAFRGFFSTLNSLILGLDEATRVATAFVFGYLGGAPVPFETKSPGGEFILAFRALPLVLVVSALSSLLFYWRVLPLVVRGFAWLLHRTMHIGGALGLSAAANIFVGMVEAPLLVRPYLLTLSRSELFAMMTCGMAGIAGTVMVLYATLLGPVVPDALGHILTASIISAPAALLIARLMVPEDRESLAGEASPVSTASGSIDAITQGTVEGLKLFLNIIAMLVVFIALVHLINQALGLAPAVGGEPLSLQRMLGWLLAPLAWLLGIPWQEAVAAGGLLGVKAVLNELLAYLQMAALPEGTLSERSRLILTYALCGFANPGSLGIMIGGLSAMVPERREEVVALGLRTILAGTLATCMTGAVIGVIA